MAEWSFTVYGIPKAQGRARAVRVGPGVRMYDPETSVDWKNQVRLTSLAYKPDEPSTGPLSIILGFRLPRPKSLPKHRTPLHTKKPDLDNLEKAILDALKGVFYRDDSQIFRKVSHKEYSRTPSVEIVLWEVE